MAVSLGIRLVAGVALIALAVPLTACSAPVNVVPDIGFQYCLNSYYLHQRPIDSPITPAQLRSLRGRVSTCEVGSLEGAQYLTGIAELSLAGNPTTDQPEFSDLSPLAGLVNLTSLDVSGNQVSDLSALAGLTNLTDLNVAANHVTDLSPLAGLTNLTNLDVSDFSWLGGWWTGMSTRLTICRRWLGLSISPISVWLATGSPTCRRWRG